MKPIKFNEKLLSINNGELIKRLEQSTLKMIETNNKDKIFHLSKKHEQLLVLGILRILYNKLHYIVYQNKIYENVQFYLNKQDAYNINRSISVLRRMREMNIFVVKDEKYLNWFKNRIKYATVAIKKYLKESE